MKIDSIIPIDHAQIAEVGTRRLGRHQVLGTWGDRIALSAANFSTTFTPRTPADADLAQRLADDEDLTAGSGIWGDGDSLANVPRGLPASIRLAIDPTLAPEGDA